MSKPSNNNLAKYFASATLDNAETKNVVKKTNKPNRPNQGRVLRASTMSKRKANANKTRNNKRNKAPKTNNTNYSKNLPPGVKFITSYNKPSKNTMDISGAMTLIDEVQSLPVYYITGHSCICPRDRPCFFKRKEPSEFIIPEDTYIITYSVPGEFYCGNDKLLVHNHKVIRDYLYMHSQSDLNASDKVGTSKLSFFGGIKRATSSKDVPIEYPNITFELVTFYEDEQGKKITEKGIRPPRKNPHGIYDAFKASTASMYGNLDNTLAYIPQDESHKDIYLKDIIELVYAKSGTRKGVFILGGCMETCMRGQDREDLNVAARKMEYANNMYNTIKKTFVKEDLQRLNLERYIPGDNGLDIDQAFSTTSLEEITEMKNKDLTSAKAYSKLPLLVHYTNRGNLEKLASKEMD
jgi:hypothetical protein